ncbi:zinc-binding dehydrogenase [Chloroflexota bacterium]
MKAWRVYVTGDMRLDDIPLPEVKPGSVLMKVKLLQLSVTEVVRLQSGLGNLEETIKEKGPIQLGGHEFCGEVVEVGEGVENVKVGERGFWVHGRMPNCLAEYTAPLASDVMSIPDVISDNEAAAMQPLVSSIGYVYTAKIELGDTVAVLGQGVMGLNCMQISRVCGAGRVIGVDVRDESLAVSAKLGADITIDAHKVDPVEAVLEITKGVGADVIFECAGGNPAQGLSATKTLNQALSMVRNNGKIMQVGLLPHDATVPVSVLNDKSIRYMGHVFGPFRLANYAVNLVKSKRVQVAPYITHVLEGLDKVPKAIEITGNKTKYGAINPAQVVVAQ